MQVAKREHFVKRIATRLMPRYRNASRIPIIQEYNAYILILRYLLEWRVIFPLFKIYRKINFIL